LGSLPFPENHFMKRLLFGIAAFMLSTAALLPPQAMAQVNVSVNIGTPPPPLRYERVPPPRHGYVWAPGYWGWTGRSHVWVRGHWERARSGYIYQRPGWREDNGRWHLNKGGWKQRKHDREFDREFDRKYDRKYDRKHDKYNDGYHCPPGHAKKGEC
jgi:hypothetical protein